jgi:hypothetical protein
VKKEKVGTEEVGKQPLLVAQEMKLPKGQLTKLRRHRVHDVYDEGRPTDLIVWITDPAKMTQKITGESNRAEEMKAIASRLGAMLLVIPEADEAWEANRRGAPSEEVLELYRKQAVILREWSEVIVQFVPCQELDRAGQHRALPPPQLKTEAGRFDLGASYTRREISSRLGGSVQSYLPHTDEIVRAACLRLDTNPGAPGIILVGTGPGIERAAEMLIAQRTSVPTFLKRGLGKWEYVGDYAVDHWSSDGAELAAQAKRSGRKDITRIIYMTPR